ncbi:hypothetical protein NE237_019347 [Protea cynaroides]|uniref:Uncharacterized protein n=1 Tax=Protea cynaroides TaxID=273540 RepID=A0A9Q0QPX1_9MAGN|nr:hypothetical protein NE237_019347 [Protea cynaroides]
MISMFSLLDTIVAAESLGLGSFLTSPGTQDRIFRRETEQNRFLLVTGAESPDKKKEKKEKKKISPPVQAKTLSLFDTMVAAESLGLDSFLTSPGTQDRIIRRGTEQNRFPRVTGAESLEKKEKKKISPPVPAKTLRFAVELDGLHLFEAIVP